MMTTGRGKTPSAPADPTVWPHPSQGLKVSILTSLLLSPVWAAADWPDFDRPGILFAPSVLPVGVWSLELGLPEFSRTTSGDVRLLESELHSLFRYGLTTHWEVQFEMAPWVRERVKTDQATTTRTGYSDARVALRHDASATMAATFAADAVALQAGVTLNMGHADFRASRNTVDLGIVASWALPADGHGVDAMLQWEGTSSESSWFLATTYGAPINGNLSAFVEAGAWFGDKQASIAGFGLIWRATAGFQIDSYMLTRLSGETADMQMGLGVSWLFL